MLRKKKIVIVVGLAVAVALACFVVIALLPRPSGPFFADPLRSVLSGVGLLAVALPFYLFGSIIRKQADRSPYFEEAFIAGFINLFAFVCFVVGLICVGLCAYTLIKRFLGSD